MTDYRSQGFCADCLHPAASSIPTLCVVVSSPALLMLHGGLLQAFIFSFRFISVKVQGFDGLGLDYIIFSIFQHFIGGLNYF